MDEEKKVIPAVGVIVNRKEIAKYIELYGRELVTYCVRSVIDNYRDSEKNNAFDENDILRQVKNKIETIANPSFKQVINATGIILHTNLGRAPLGAKVLDELGEIISGYSNIEFNLNKGCRGHRNEYITELLKYLTGAEDALVVNNNAAAIILALYSLAKNKEVIISRSELIEIGGSFRIPDIMKTSGCKMVEVGTTNKTRISDYEEAITDKTALIFKAHRSNFTMSGFVEEVSIAELAGFSRQKGIPFLYDIGSGLLQKPENLPLGQEPDVRSVMKWGVDIAAFSGDKMLGGPQAGILVGRKEYIRKFSKNPLMRAFRVGKLTMGALITVCKTYLSDETLVNHNPVFAMMSQNEKNIRTRAEMLCELFISNAVAAEVVEGTTQIGGGTLPDVMMKSWAVKIVSSMEKITKKKTVAEDLFMQLMQYKHPVVGVLREGFLVFEVSTVSDNNLKTIAQAVTELMCHSENNRQKGALR